MDSCTRAFPQPSLRLEDGVPDSKPGCVAWLPLWFIVTREPLLGADNRTLKGRLSLKEGWALLRDRWVLGYAS